MDCWTQAEYEDVLASVEENLWLFVQDNAKLHSPKSIVSHIAQLSVADMKLLQNIHFLLSQPVRNCVYESLPSLLKRLPQTTRRAAATTSDAIRGSIDWSLTIKSRFTPGQNHIGYVCRTTEKTYDVLEVQAVKLLLMHIHSLCKEVLGRLTAGDGDKPYAPDETWKGDVRRLFHATDVLLKSAIVRNVTAATRISDTLMQKIRCARSHHYQAVYQSLFLFRKLIVQQETRYLQSCISQSVLRPLDRNVLYEVYILFLTLACLKRAGWDQTSLKLIGNGKGALATYQRNDAALRVYYQSVPAVLSQESLYTELLRQYDLDATLRRPDIVLEFLSEKQNIILVEVKRTQNKPYIIDSVYKIFGYLKDFEACFAATSQTKAMLVVWEGVEGSPKQNFPLLIANKSNFERKLQEIDQIKRPAQPVKTDAG